MTRPAHFDPARLVVDAIGVDRLARAMARDVAQVPVYRELADTPTWVEVEQHVREHAAATLRSLATGSPPEPDALAFVVTMAVRRARQGMPLAAMLHAYRAGYGAVWEAIRSETSRLGVDAEVVARLGGTAVEYFNAISTAVADAYLAEAQALQSAALHMRRTIVERLLAGAALRPDTPLADHGLADPARTFVLVAIAVDGEGELERICQRVSAALERGLQRAVLCAVARHRVVAVLGAADDTHARALEDAVAQLWRGDELRGTRAGLSTARAGLAEVPAAFVEAERAARMADAARPFVALARARLFDDLLGRADPTTMRLLPAWSRALLEEDAGSLCETILAYLGQEQSVARCAQRLGVHPNTVRHRLGRVEAITGCSTRSFDDLVELAIVLRLASRSGRGSP